MDMKGHRGTFGHTLQLLLLALLLLAGSPLRAQIAICEDFDTITLGGPGEYVMPDGWTVYFAGSPHTNSSNAYVTIVSYPDQVLRLSSGCYLFLPDYGTDLANGAWLSFDHFNISSTEGTLIVGTAPSLSSATFHPLDTLSVCKEPSTCHIDLSNAPPGDRYVVLWARFMFSYLNNLILSPGCGAGNLTADSVTADSIYLSWQVLGTPQVTLTLVDLDDTTQTVYPQPTEARHVALPHTANHHEQIVMDYVCDTSGDPCLNRQYTLSPPAYDNSTCVNIAFLHSNRVTPYYGKFHNPYSHVGAIDHGPTWASSRHTVNTDTTQYDPRVGSALRVIPPGETMSVRLGNSGTNADAEALLYNIPVDTTVMDMLILKYAAVMQDPNHDSTDQPRFRIEMLDDTMGVIEPVGCNSADFIASPSLGWNSTGGGSILWKDWTIVGIDLSAYHNRTVHLRLTTYDCKRGAHYGYAYFTLSCAQKTIALSSCTADDSVQLSAPEGFTYRWHLAGDDSILSTQRHISIPIDNNLYNCHLGFVGNPACEVTLSARSRVVQPVAAFDYSVEREGCRFKVTFRNLSHPSDDTAARCNLARWSFPGATPDLSTDLNPTVYWPDTGTFDATLVSGMTIIPCTDSVTHPLRFDYGRDTLARAICADTAYLFVDTLLATSGTYSRMPNCDSILTLHLTVHDTNIIDTVAEVCEQLLYRDSLFTASGHYPFVYPNRHGCDSTYWLHLTVHPARESTDTLVICPWRPYLYRGVDYGHPVQFDTVLYTVHRCDSLVHVTLQPRDSLYHLTPLYRVDSTDWLEPDSLLAVCAPATLDLRDTTPLATAHDWLLFTADSLRAASTAEATWHFPHGHTGVAAFVSLVDTDPWGCLDTVGWPLVVLPRPVPEFRWERDVPAIHDPVLQFYNLTRPDTATYLWRIQSAVGGPFDTTSQPEPFYRWGEPGDNPEGDYTVRLLAHWEHTVPPFRTDTLFPPANPRLGCTLHPTLVHTCVDSVEHQIYITNDYLQFPDLVTPNGDGVNERWEVKNLLEYGNYTMNELWIYDRTGALVYHVRNISQPEHFWDPNATRSPDGTYYYRFTAQGEYGIVKRNGLIEVLR